ncbi:hypothetical protein B0H10DRAFT_1955403 [Mycena sp. CBHHK59/15]|nr:hypothetical protein B0H10DRAFT_1955403 [Mycena sp. CBHHK59/15]
MLNSRRSSASGARHTFRISTQCISNCSATRGTQWCMPGSAPWANVHMNQAESNRAWGCACPRAGPGQANMCRQSVDLHAVRPLVGEYQNAELAGMAARIAFWRVPSHN